MTTSPAFLKLANSSIESEILTCFSDSALHRRLSWGGVEGSHAYVHREFAPASYRAPHLSNTVHCRSSFDALHEKDAATAEGADALRSQPPSHSPLKRRRTSLLEELKMGMQSMEAVHFTGDIPRDLPQPQTEASIEKSKFPLSRAPQPSVSSTLKDAPFIVTCQRCSTRVVSVYPCRVLKGYVVLWAQSLLSVSCVPAKDVSTATPLPALHDIESTAYITDSTAASGKLEGAGKRAALPRGRGSPLESKTALATAMDLRPLAHRANIAPDDRKGNGNVGKLRSRKRCIADIRAAATTADHGTLQYVLDSLHIVNGDAVKHPRPQSYVLQSVLQPGMPMALESYPRHMIHFGLLCFAAWHASDEFWEDLLKCGDQRAQAAHGARHTPRGATRNGTFKAPQPSYKGCQLGSGTSPSSFASFLPHTAEDAVLILGLGGNVLGQCLDAVLPPAVPLHIVEVEPAVLQACEEHHQFPPCASPGTQNEPLTFNAARASSAQRRKSAKVALSEASPSVSVPTDVWGDAAVLIQQKGSECVVFSALRQQNNNSGALPDGSTNCNTTKTTIDAAAVAATTTQRRRSYTSASSQQMSGQRGDGENRSEYRCFLQDAYVFLRQTTQPNALSETVKPAAPSPSLAPQSSSSSRAALNTCARRNCVAHPSSSAPLSGEAQGKVKHCETNGVSGAQVSVATVSCIPPVQYSMIFLDCYDPDREHMMHEGRLIDLCVRRLQPGGVLLVNAHVLPNAETLERDFLSHGFATVQALRVSGYTQTVLVCIAPDTKKARRKTAEERSARCARFTLHQLQLLAHRLSSLTASLPREADGSAAEETPERLLRFRFQLDASWLKTCRRMQVSKGWKGATSSSRNGKAMERARADNDEVDFRVWQHHF